MATRKSKKHLRRAAESRDRSVFLNIPYDAAFENLLLAYIADLREISTENHGICTGRECDE